MSKRIGVLVLLCLSMLLLTSCSSPGYSFVADDIQFNLIHYEASNGHRSYTVAVRNNGKLDVKYVNLYLSYPIILDNGSKGNPFKLEGKSGVGPNHIESGSVVLFEFDAPISEVFGSSLSLDWENPQIELSGIVQDGKSKVPIGISGSYLEIK